MSAQVLILGAHSDIGRALAHEYARHGHSLYLAARQPERLEADVSDLQIRYGVSAAAFAFDATAYETHEDFWKALSPRPEIVFCVFGYYADPQQAQTNWQMAREMMEVNYVGAVSILEIVAKHLEQAQSGAIAGISSVAGDRGRAKNYLYGSSKAAFSAYLSGLRNRLHSRGVQVLTVKPGYVDTKMTAGMKLPPILTATPQQVARDVYKAVTLKYSSVYSRWYWRYIMLVIRLIPEFIFKRMRI